MTITNPDWVPPIEYTFDTGQAIRSEQGLMLAGNPIAIALGKAGAPRVLLPALERLQPGNQIRSRNDAAVTSGVALSFAFIQHGTIRAVTTLTNASGTPQAQVRRTRNGVTTVLGSRSTLGTLTVDADVIPGDVLDIFLGTPASSGRITNSRLQTNGQDLWPGSAAILEGNRSAP